MLHFSSNASVFFIDFGYIIITSWKKQAFLINTTMWLRHIWDWLRFGQNFFSFNKTFFNVSNESFYVFDETGVFFGEKACFYLAKHNLENFICLNFILRRFYTGYAQWHWFFQKAGQTDRHTLAQLYYYIKSSWKQTTRLQYITCSTRKLTQTCTLISLKSRIKRWYILTFLLNLLILKFFLAVFGHTFLKIIPQGSLV